jgi:hypothetical protein
MGSTRPHEADTKAIGMSTESLWQEVEDLAQARDGSYDVGSIVRDIEATFGPSSMRELPDAEIERLFQKHQAPTAR